jgi:hypothetical protein
VIGFLFGIAVGVPLGFLLGAIAMAGSKMEREMRRKSPAIDLSLFDPPDLTVKREGIDHLYRKVGDRSVAGVRVCSCIGNLARGPHYINPNCPFHGGAA